MRKSEVARLNIQYLYETHLEVRDLEAAIAFYEQLGLRQGVTTQHAAFLWIGDSNQQMLGLWKTPNVESIDKRHFAFHVSLEDLLNAKAWLAERGIELIPNKGFETTEPVVHPWMPAASVYFNDLDGNKLEFISVLPHPPQIMENRVYLSEWLRINEESQA